jgi:hypothetical protein
MFFFDGEDLTVADENDIWLYIEECDVGEYEAIFDVDGAVFEFRQEADKWLLRPTGANDLPRLGASRREICCGIEPRCRRR